MEVVGHLCYDRPTRPRTPPGRDSGYLLMQQAIGATNAVSQNPTYAPDEVELTVIVPTRNEADNIAPLLHRLEHALDEKRAEVLFVDDSTDATPSVIQQKGLKCSLPVRVIVRPIDRRNGLSGAVVEGMDAARGRWICVIDADLQHPPELIPRLLERANRTGADMVVASRQADYLGPVGLSRARAMTSQLLTILARVVFPRVLKNVSDPLTGFFLVRRTAVDTAHLQPEGFKILLEILVRHPDLRVTEVHFEFAPRREGQSKADLHEGIRFFRHLARLRLTINQHLVRFLVVVLLALVLNLALLGWLASAGWAPLYAAAAAGALTIAAVLVGETWIFSDRPRGPARKRLAGVLLVSLLFLFAVYLPVIWFLAGQLGAPLLLAGLVAMLLAGFIYYAFSEQWIWTRGLMMRPRANLYYDIHGIVAIASQIPLSDLAYFQRPEALPRVDLQLRVDRHGTPSRVPGAICYDEHLGRFGFGLTVMPGDFTEIVVSPLLESSPAFLYTNVVEPVLRWVLVSKGYSLAQAGAARFGAEVALSAIPAPAVLITGQPDLSYGLGRLCRDKGLAFMGDDRVIIGRDRRVLSFPKPVTSRGEMRPENVSTLSSSLGLRMQRLLYSRPVRRLGLFLSERRLPAATVNTYLQRLIPQPKHPIDELVSGIHYADKASPESLLWLDRGDGESSALSLETAIDRLVEPSRQTFGFRPYPLLVEALSTWYGRDWASAERDILRAGLTGCRTIQWRSRDDNWWEHISGVLRTKSPADTVATKPLAPKSV